jgi:uncharacterized protein YkwD
MTSIAKTSGTKISVRLAASAAALALLAACGGQTGKNSLADGARGAITLGAPPSAPTTTVAATTTTAEPTTTVAETIPPSTEVDAESSDAAAAESAPEAEPAAETGAPEPEPEQEAPAPPTTQRKKPVAAAPAKPAKPAPAKPAPTTAPAPPPTEPPAPAPTDPPEPEPTNPPQRQRPSADTSVGGQIIASVNAARKAAGLGAVSGNGALAAIAADHSSDQAANSHMSHTGSDGSSLGQRMSRGGYGASAYAENVAAGYGSAESVMKGWMNSAGHKANILGNYTQIGVAVAYSADGTPYWTMDLGRP